MRERILLFIAPITKIIDCVTCYIYYTKQQKTQYVLTTWSLLCFLLIIHTCYQIHSNLLSRRIASQRLQLEALFTERVQGWGLTPFFAGILGIQVL